MNTTETITGAMYEISLQKFKDPLQSWATHYSLGDPITRENFTAAMIGSFAISKGNPEAQLTVFEWLKANYGFDFEATLGNYIEAGERNVLRQEEKAAIIANFRRIKSHPIKLKVEIDDGTIMRSFDSNLSMIRNKRYSAGEEIEEMKPFIAEALLKGMTREEFMSKLNSRIRVWKQAVEDPKNRP